MRNALLLLAVLFLVSVHPAGMAAMADYSMNHAASVSGGAGHDMAGQDMSGTGDEGQAGVPCCQGMAASQAGAEAEPSW